MKTPKPIIRTTSVSPFSVSGMASCDQQATIPTGMLSGITKRALVVATGLFLASQLMADIFVPTTINTTAWVKGDNNYIISADATVPSGQVLTIEPGVVVIIAPGVQLNVQGKIIAVGSPSEHITFRGASPTGYWNRIYVRDNGNGLSRFLWCNFSEATDALSLRIHSRNATMRTEIRNCSFSNCTDSAVYAQATTTAAYQNTYSPTLSPVITNCSIRDCDSNGIEFNISGAIYAQGSGFQEIGRSYAHPVIKNNIFANIGGNAFVFVAGNYAGTSQPNLVNNSVSGAEKGIEVQDPYDLLVKNSIFANCTSGIERINASARNLQIQHNCFFNNTADFVNYPAAYGTILWQNANGDDADISFNIFEDPMFADVNTLAIAADSPCIDAGDHNLRAYTDICFDVSQGTTVADQGAYGGADAGNWLDVVPLISTTAWMSKSDTEVSINWDAIPRSTYRFQYITNLADTAWKNLTDITASGHPGSTSVTTPEDLRFFRIQSLGRAPGD